MIHLKKTLLTLTALFALSTGAGATELTVFDGTATTYLPFVKSYLYCYQKNEMLFPCENLADMKGQKISAIQFHSAQKSYDFGNVGFKVFLKEISTYEFITSGTNTLFYGPDDATTVYEGSFSVEDYKLTITFNTPYAYNGGNLLVGVYVTNPVNITEMPTSPIDFYSCSTAPIASSYRNEASVSDGLDAITNGNDYQFLPKTTFTYSNVEMNDDMTEATFTMPTSDATVDYELVRDMEIAVNAVMPANIRLQKKQGGGYEPIDDTKMIPEVKDAIDGESQAVTMTEVTEQTAETGDYTLKLQKLGDGETWVDADPNDLSVGTYRYEVTGANLYDGVCYTNEFKLFEGYPVTVPAHGFVTYYSDENLTVDESSAAQLYTITNVSGNTAIATPIPSANEEMPFLIYNPTDDEQTFMLIPTENQINQSVYLGFKGTLEGKTFTAAEMAATDHYVVNNAQFVWVKDPGTIAAHRSWLELTKNSAARAITILFGDATAIGAVSGSAADNGDIYDLNGRKVQRPVKKGVYIQNGQKKVMK